MDSTSTLIDHGNGKRRRPWDPTRETTAKPNCVTTGDAAGCGGGYTKRERGAEAAAATRRGNGEQRRRERWSRTGLVACAVVVGRGDRGVMPFNQVRAGCAASGWCRGGGDDVLLPFAVC
jgi:hypothetical protein